MILATLTYGGGGGHDDIVSLPRIGRMCLRLETRVDAEAELVRRRVFEQSVQRVHRLSHQGGVHVRAVYTGHDGGIPLRI